MINHKTTDEVLIKLVKKNDEEAFNMLLFRWNNLLSLLCVEYARMGKQYGVTFQELKNVAEFSFYNSLKFYDSSKSNLKTYLNLVVKQALYKYVKASEERFIELSQYVNLDNFSFDTHTIIENIIPDINSSVVNWCVFNDEFESFDQMDEEIISQKDKHLLYLRAAGYSYDESTKLLKTTKSRAGFTLKKIRNVVKK